LEGRTRKKTIATSVAMTPPKIIASGFKPSPPK
jgi:hypothetical protein